MKVDALLGEPVGGEMDAVVLYLSPKDYHRVHAPREGRVVRWRYVPGTLWPVYALPAFLGQEPAMEPQVVLLELAGIQAALCASRVHGIEHRLASAGEPGRWWTADGRVVLAPDVTRLLGASNLTGPRPGPSDA